MVWDDLQCLLALRRAGSIGGAARALKIDASTVSRRLAALEASLGVQLVTRTKDGVKFNDEGMLAADTAEAIEQRIAQLESAIGGKDGKPEGAVRVAVSDGFADLLYRGLSKLREEHPGICVELVISAGAADLARGDADVAIRMYRETSGDLVLRKAGTLGWALYAADAYLERKGKPSSFAGHDLIGYSGPAARSPGGKWLDTNVSDASIVTRSSTTVAAMRAAMAGFGIAALPCFIGDASSLVRLSDVIGESEAFIVMPRDHQNVARVRIVADALALLFEEHRALFSGRK